MSDKALGFWQRLEFYPEKEQVEMVYALMKMSPQVEQRIIDSVGFMKWIAKHKAAATEWAKRQTTSF